MRYNGAVRRPCHPLALAALLASAITVGTGCVSKPTMRLHHAEISGVQMGLPPSLFMTVVLQVTNPNAYDVAVRAVRGQVIMADKFSFPIDWRPAQAVWMPADRTTVVRVPVVLPMQTVWQLLREAVATPIIGYRVVGAADVIGTRTFQIEKDDYAVDERGTISRAEIAAVLPNSVFPPR
jgi:LEA14-like dessication related protein